MTQTSRRKVDVLILCALQDEFNELLNVTEGVLAPGWQQRRNPQGWTIAEATFAGDNGEKLTILGSFSSGMGREMALAMISQLLQEHPARCLAMTGICAGRRGKVTLGDVIFADRLYSYDAGKVTVEDGISKFEGDSLQYHLRPVWKQRIESTAIVPDRDWVGMRPELTHEYQEDWVLLQRLDEQDPPAHVDFKAKCPDWTDVLKRLWKRGWLARPMVLTEIGRRRAEELRLLYPYDLPRPPAFNVEVAPIATGAAVTEDEGIFPRLALSMRKVLGVDMEASALGVAGDFQNLPVVVVKGVSDYGDAFKDDRYRTFAARASAECLIALMKQATDLIPGRQENIGPLPISRNLGVPIDLIRELANAYPDANSVRSVWERAGGQASDVENIPRPQDLWQRLWMRSTQGAAVRPVDLLRVIHAEFPDNAVVTNFMAHWENK
jgi:nucleoside phosphorylase